eukprot:scaffold2729_cov188-Ochromonas_danica.AAC.7
MLTRHYFCTGGGDKVAFCSGRSSTLPLFSEYTWVDLWQILLHMFDKTGYENRLDIACVEKNARKGWLTSLTDLRTTQALTTKRLFSDDEMKAFYNWLGSRKVLFVEEFPVRPEVLEDLVGGLLDMESYCPTLRSIDIYTWSTDDGIPDIDQVKNDLSVFLSHCHNLRGVTVRMGYVDRYFGSFGNIVLSVLVEKLRENSLVKISLQSQDLYTTGDKSHVLVANLLIKHVSSFD